MYRMKPGKKHVKETKNLYLLHWFPVQIPVKIPVGQAGIHLCGGITETLTGTAAGKEYGDGQFFKGNPAESGRLPGTDESIYGLLCGYMEHCGERNGRRHGACDYGGYSCYVAEGFGGTDASVSFFRKRGRGNEGADCGSGPQTVYVYLFGRICQCVQRIPKRRVLGEG